MSALHAFLFDGLPVRGVLVRLDHAWQQMVSLRQARGAYPEPVTSLLGQMTVAGLLMQGNIKFNGTLTLQIMGDGPLKLAVAEVQSDLRFRATASLSDEGWQNLPAQSDLGGLVNVHGQGRCAITLTPAVKQPGQQAYQGVVSLLNDQEQRITSLGAALEHYMRKSQQINTTLVLAANASTAAGLLIQALPITADLEQEAFDPLESYRRIALLSTTLQSQELLTLDEDAVLHRLFWQEKLTRFAPKKPSFSCTCSQEKVSAMLHGLGADEVQKTLQQQGAIEIGCEFCGAQYRFDGAAVAELFKL